MLVILHGRLRKIAVVFVAASLIGCSSCNPEKKHHRYTTKLFHLQDGIWTPAPESEHVSEYVVSRRGVLWTLDASGRLSKMDGGRWTRFGNTEFREPTRLGVPMRHLALWGEGVWKTTAEGAACFNGKSWRLDKGTLKTDWPVDIVSDGSGIWIIDFYGNLSHFDGNNWTVQNLQTISSAPPPQGWRYWLDADVPARLALTGDGRLWIFWHGLWRQEGGGWREIPVQNLDLTRALLVGHDEGGVWLASGEGIVLVTADGRVGAHHSWGEMGLPRQPAIGSLAVAGGRTWVATSGGLLVFDGQHWRNIGHPAGYDWIEDVAVATDGSAWVLGVKELP